MSLHDPSPHTVATTLLVQPVASLSTEPSCCSEHAQRPPPLLFKHVSAPFLPLLFHIALRARHTRRHCRFHLKASTRLLHSTVFRFPPAKSFTGRPRFHSAPSPSRRRLFPKPSSGRTKLHRAAFAFTDDLPRGQFS